MPDNIPKDSREMSIGSKYALMVLIVWNEFKNIDLECVRDAIKTPMIFDGRNIYDSVEMRALGFINRGVGRGFDGK